MSNEMMAIIIAAGFVMLHNQLCYIMSSLRTDNIERQLKDVNRSLDHATRKINSIERALTEKATVQN